MKFIGRIGILPVILNSAVLGIGVKGMYVGFIENNDWQAAHGWATTLLGVALFLLSQSNAETAELREQLNKNKNEKEI